MNPNYVAEVLEMHIKSQGLTLDEACQEMLRGGFPPEWIEGGRVLVAARIQAVKSLDEPMAIAGDGQKDWYPGPRDKDRCWPALRRYMKDDRKWPEPVIRSVDDASTRIVSLLHGPGRDTFDTRGLVLGYVQSGKTANFTAVIAKAVDAGYKFIIVLSGLHNALRSQTQKRLVDELVTLNPTLWHQLTSIKKDFTRQGNASAFLAENANQKVLCVMKKNATRLRAMRTWLKSVDKRILATCPTLIIDDEADQASIDTSKSEDNPSTINKLIREILEVLPKVGYIAYTATPFANILTDPGRDGGLYPSDFIVDLPRPTAYFGAARIFGSGEDDDDGLDMFREVSGDEIQLLKPARRDERESFRPGMAQSLAAALSWFWMAASTRLARGQADKHMSMLIHTTLYTDVHLSFEELLERERKRILGLVQAGDASLKATMKAQWEDEVPRISSQEMGETPISFETMWAQLPGALKSTQIIIDNAKSTNRLSFPEDSGSIQIVVGGNTLSRGLTIEGLMVSYFIRASSMYDTLMQMGRWFGYRMGYADLPRIWMTADLLDAFQHIARVELEIRDDISRYEREGITPRDFAPWIQTHSTLAITSPLKMQYAVQQRMSFNSAVKQTTYFKHSDAAWLEANIASAKTLLARADALHSAEKIWDSHTLYRRVPATDILSFLSSYQVHDEKHADMQPEHLKGYITDQNGEGQLTLWNVAVVSQKKDTAGTWSGLLPGGAAINLISRARFGTSEPANIKALMSKTDRGIDFGLEAAPRQKDKPAKYDTFTNWMAGVRSPGKAHPTDPDRGIRMPLLLLYPISKDSTPDPKRKSTVRHPLNAARHVIGLAIIFPRTPRLTPQGYVTADLSRLESGREEVEHTPEEDGE